MTARLATGRIGRAERRALDGRCAANGGARRSWAFRRNTCDIIHRAMWQVNNDRRGTAYGSRVMEEAYLVAGKTGTSQVRNITTAEREAGRDLATRTCPGNGATTRCSWATRPSRRRATPCRSWWSMAAAARLSRPDRARHPAQGFRWGHPAARALPGVRSAATSRRCTAPADPRGTARALGPRLRPPGTGDGPRMSFLEYNVATTPTGWRKILHLNWALVLLLVAVACLGFLMLFSVAGGSMTPWVEPQMQRFGLGLTLMFVVAMVPIWFWRNLSALAYGCRCSCCCVEFFGSVGMGAQRWIDLGFMRLQPSELTKITLVMVLAAYYDWLDARQDLAPGLRDPAGRADPRCRVLLCCASPTSARRSCC
jgi:hypothetical protein